MFNLSAYICIDQINMLYINQRNMLCINRLSRSTVQRHTADILWSCQSSPTCSFHLPANWRSSHHVQRLLELVISIICRAFSRAVVWSEFTSHVSSINVVWTRWLCLESV